MSSSPPDQRVRANLWSDLEARFGPPRVNVSRMRRYRLERLREQLRASGVSLCLLVNPVSLRYAVDCRSFALFQAHIPTTYLFVPADGPVVIHSVYGPTPECVDELRPGRAISFFDGGTRLTEQARGLASDLRGFLAEIGSDNRRVAIEYVNPSITQACERAGLEVIDAVEVVARARMIKSDDEIAAIRWAMKAANLGIAQVEDALAPGTSELQLWALLNYANLANNGDWHDGRMLASGPRINPWYQEASPRRLEAGDLVGLDTDMIGPFGYCVDVSRTFYCGPGKPTPRQRQLYRLALHEINHNLKLLRPGLSLAEFQSQAFVQEEEFHPNAYTCILHGVGMSDEYPRVNPAFRGANPYDGQLDAGMVVTLESYVGAVGERDGVKLEQQVLIADEGYELLSDYPLDEDLSA